MLEVGQPFMFLAAAGILIPLAIHLWNRKPPRLIPAGSIRWFRGSTSQSARSLQLKNWPLLLLRCLMLLVFCLLLADLYWQASPTEKEEKNALFLVEAGIASGKSQAWADSLLREGKEARLLAPGLPGLQDTLQWKETRIDIWGIMKEADAQLAYPDTVWIYSPLLLRHFSGERPWVNKQFVFEEPAYPQQALTFPVQYIREGNTITVKEVAYLPDRISFQRKEVTSEGIEGGDLMTGEASLPLLQKEALTPAFPDTFLVGMSIGEAYQPDAQIMQQAFEVLDSQIPELVILFQEAIQPNNPNLLLWLREDPLPDSIRQLNLPVVGIREGSKSGEGWLIQPAANAPLLYFLQERPLPEFVEREKLASLPLALLELLPEGVEGQYKGYLQMPLAQAQANKMDGKGRKRTAEKQPLHKGLWVLLFAMFMVERIWVNLK